MASFLGSFDSIKAIRGEISFLELNQMGQFPWLDGNNDFPMLSAFCDFVELEGPNSYSSMVDRKTYSTKISLGMRITQNIFLTIALNIWNLVWLLLMKNKNIRFLLFGWIASLSCNVHGESYGGARSPDSPISRCAPIEGLLETTGAKKSRFVIFGEVHGTSEIPRFFGDAACELSATQKIVIALEYNHEDGEALNQYIHAGANADAANVLSHGEWIDVTRDGRTSGAMFQMVEGLHQLVNAGRNITIVGLIPKEEDELSQDYYELGIANELRIAASNNVDATIVVLIGNVHARKGPIKKSRVETLRPAASLLPARDVLALRNEPTSGMAWNCQADLCGEHAIPAQRSSHHRGVFIDSKPYDGYDGYFVPGTDYTASKPATIHSRIVDENVVPVQP